MRLCFESIQWRDILRIETYAAIHADYDTSSVIRTSQFAVDVLKREENARDNLRKPKYDSSTARILAVVKRSLGTETYGCGEKDSTSSEMTMFGPLFLDVV